MIRAYCLMHRLVLAAAYLLAVSLLVPAALAHDSGHGAELGVERMTVTPGMLRPGGEVTVKATVVNVGHADVERLSLGLAASKAGGAGQRWIPISASPSEPVARLAPGDEVAFEGKLRLDTSGIFRVGLVGTAANAALFPQGKQVRVLETEAAIADMLLLATIYAALLGLLTLGGWATIKSRGQLTVT